MLTLRPMGCVVPNSSLVTGYDFLAQPANAVETELASGIGAGGTDGHADHARRRVAAGFEAVPRRTVDRH